MHVSAAPAPSPAPSSSSNAMSRSGPAFVGGSTATLRGSTMITPNPFSQLSHDALVGAAAVAQEHCTRVGARLHVSTVASDTLGVPAALLLTFEPGKNHYDRF